MRRSASSTARVSRLRQPSRKSTKNPTIRFSADEAHTQRSRKSPRCGSALAELHPRRADPDVDAGVDHRVFPHVVDLQHLPAAPASTGGAAGRASRLCSRPQLHLGAAHQGAVAYVRDTDENADHHGPDHDAADHASYDNAAAADSAAWAAAAVRAWYADSHHCSARPGSGTGTCTCTPAAGAARPARPARPARMTRPASSARSVSRTHEVRGYTGDP